MKDGKEITIYQVRERRGVEVERKAVRGGTGGTLAGAPVKVARRLRRVAKMGAWLMVQPSTVNSTELGAQEWRDALLLRYRLDPLYLPKLCDIYNFAFSIFNSLDCNKAGLVTARHNEIRGGVADLAIKTFTSTHVSDNPLIFEGRVVQRPKYQPAGTTPSQ